MARQGARSSFLRRMGRRLSGPLLVLLSIGIVIVLFEIPLRFFRSVDQKAAIEDLLDSKSVLSSYLAKLNFMRYDEKLGVVKCAPGEHFLGGGRYAYRCNSLGFRGPEWKRGGRNSILLLGDSQTFGAYLPYEKTFAFRLGRLLDADILNSGIGGYGQREQLKVLKYYGPRYRPRNVVLFFYANDPGDNSREGIPYLVVKGFLIRRMGFDGRPRNPVRIAPLLAQWESGRKEPLVNYLRSELGRRRVSAAEDQPRDRGDSIRTWVRTQVERSRVLELIRRGYDSAKTRVKGVIKRRLRGRAYYWKAWSGEPNFRVTIDLLDKILEEIRRLSARPLLVAIPSPTEISQLEKGDAFTMGSFIKEYGKRRNVPAIILAEYFKGRDYCKYFGPKMKCDDKHLSELGARLTAEVVANFMKNRVSP